MRRVILGLTVSLDGFIEGPNGEYDWCFTDQDYGMDAFFAHTDTMFIGRKSYELMQRIGDVPGGLPELKEYVFSNTLTRVEGGAILISGDISEQVLSIKQEEGKDIWLFGGASLTTSLINLGLVDTLWLSMHPILLGGGTKLFSGIQERLLLNLVSSKTYDTGLVSLTYDIARFTPSGKP